MAIDGFTKLSPNILIYTPPAPKPGQLVVLGTWMGAADKHIAKYTTLYRQRLPNVRILLLKSYVTSMVQPYSTQQKAMEPAERYVRQFLEESGYQGRGCQTVHTSAHVLTWGNQLRHTVVDGSGAES